MIEFLMRKIIYRNLDRESQDRIVKLTKRQHIIELVCMFWVVMYIFQIVPLVIMNICEDVKLAITIQIAINIFMLICFIGLISMKVFTREMACFSQLLAERIYFLICTTKGECLSKDDFKIIKQVNEDLYASIETQRCIRYCYSVCFEICKALKKGSLEFIAMKKFYDDEDDREYTVHVFYLNNGWVFDTYSVRQYQSIEKLHEIYKAKVYKTFSFDEISDKSYDEFKKEQEHELAKWCEINDCSVFWET